MKKATSLHFVGIKGVGMAPLAIIAQEAGIQVTGSDISDTFITDTALEEKKIRVLAGFSPSNVGNVDAVIVTNAHGGFNNPEVQAAKTKGITILSQAQAVGEYMQGEILGRSFIGISVTGSHGKTTTSAMIATLLKEAQLDPSYLIGTSYIPSLGYSGRLGKGKYFVAEADEYVSESTYDPTPKFLWQHPKFLVMTNLDHDHPDVYPNIQAVKDAFEQFIHQLDPQGILVICGDDVQLKSIATARKVITYGYGQGNDFIITKVANVGSDTLFTLRNIKSDLAQFKIKVPGDHNVLNATAAIIIGIQLGLAIDDIQKYIYVFSGSKRRLEYIGESSQGVLLYDDYAHHPTEIKASLQTIRQLFPKHFIICVFQPHTFSRTQAFFTEFSQSFDHADLVVLTDIYSSLRESVSETVSSADLCSAIKNNGKLCQYEAKITDVVKYIHAQKVQLPAVLVTMGAGDIYKILPEL